MRTVNGNSPHSALRASHPSAGFTYVALLAAIVIIGISMGAAGKYWSFVMQREREEELLFRGDQYRLAIERYFVANCGKTNMPCAQSAYPPTVEQLLSDSRFPQAKRHLRQLYLDPMTGKEFELLRDKTKGNRIVGVFSASEKEAIKMSGFPEQYQSFESKKTYKEWVFLANQTTAAGQPGAIPVMPGSASRAERLFKRSFP